VSVAVMKMAGVISLAATLATAGCSYTKPHPTELQVAAKPKRLVQPEMATEEERPDDDEGAFTQSPSAGRKNLPLAGTKWEWEGDVTTEGFEVLGDPAQFRLEFKPNGWFDFQADCRHGAGIYEASGQRIAFAIIKSSHSKCGYDSPADGFVSALEGAKSFRQADSKLYFELKREAKTMVFGFKPQ
jgi:heat shock protein HslJ